MCHILVFVFISIPQIGSTCFSSWTYCDHSVCVLFILNAWLPLILTTAWRYQLVIRISKSKKNRQRDGQKRGHMFAHSGVQHLLCCDFVLFIFVLCLFHVCTLCCQFQIIHFSLLSSVFSNAYLQRFLIFLLINILLKAIIIIFFKSAFIPLS